MMLPEKDVYVAGSVLFKARTWAEVDAWLEAADIRPAPGSARFQSREAFYVALEHPRRRPPVAPQTPNERRSMTLAQRYAL